MSTRSSIYYGFGGRIHIYYDVIDCGHYIEFGDRDNARQIPAWLAYGLCGRFGAIKWPLVSRRRYERDLDAVRTSLLRAESRADLAEEKAKGRDSRPYNERNEGMVTVPVSAVKIAWCLAKERRDNLHVAPSEYERAQSDLDALHAAGFDSWIPTLAELRESWKRD